MRPLLFYVQDDYDTSWPNLLNVLWSEKKKWHPSVTFVLVSHFKKLWKHINTVRWFCPQVYEVVPCQSDCNQYVWVAEPWSVWKVSNVDLKENCGEGVQTRKVRYLSSSLSYCVSVFLLFLYITDTSLLNMSWINAEMMCQYAYWSVYQQKLCNNCFGNCRCANVLHFFFYWLYFFVNLNFGLMIYQNKQSEESLSSLWICGVYFIGCHHYYC